MKLPKQACWMLRMRRKYILVTFKRYLKAEFEREFFRVAQEESLKLFLYGQ